MNKVKEYFEFIVKNLDKYKFKEKYQTLCIYNYEHELFDFEVINFIHYMAYNIGFFDYDVPEKEWFNLTYQFGKRIGYKEQSINSAKNQKIAFLKLREIDSVWQNYLLCKRLSVSLEDKKFKQKIIKI